MHLAAYLLRVSDCRFTLYVNIGVKTARLFASVGAAVSMSIISGMYLNQPLFDLVTNV